MLFRVVASKGDIHVADGPALYLIQEDWNDWFKFRTLYSLYFLDSTPKLTNLGMVKIGQRGMTDSTASPELDDVFDELDERFFSVRQSEDYYQSINGFVAIRELVYKGLRDCVYDLRIFEAVHNEYIMGESLLRTISASHVRGRLDRLAHGNAELTRYNFVYTLPQGTASSTVELKYEVDPGLRLQQTSMC